MKLVEILSTNKKILSIGDIVSDKNTSHSYIDNFYENEFSKYKNKSISFLEIGINNGSCFEMWKNYFTKAKQIVGIDIREDFVLPIFKDLDGVTYHFCNAYDENFVKTLPKFDIIIDDGSHLLEHQVRFIELYLDHLNSGGVMIVEDIAVGNYSNAQEQLISLVKDIEAISYEWLDFRKIKGRDDDILMIIRKK
jgi:hypothetical protein